MKFFEMWKASRRLKKEGWHRLTAVEDFRYISKMSVSAVFDHSPTREVVRDEFDRWWYRYLPLPPPKT